MTILSTGLVWEMAQDHAEAQNNLGWYYESGWGGTKDLKRACAFYMKAAQQGNCVGQVCKLCARDPTHLRDAPPTV